MRFRRVLLVGATELEIRPLTLSLGYPTAESGQWFSWRNLDLQILITGVGIPNTSYQLGKRLAADQPDFLLHLGIAGGKPGRFEPGDVVCVQEDRYGDIGVEDSAGVFQDMFNLGLWPNHPPWTDGRLVHPNPLAFDLPHPVARGLTVNLIPGTSDHISRMSARFDYEIESMEGAAVMHAAGLAGIPCVCLRGISNLIEPRNRSNWKIEQAVQAVCIAALDLLSQLDEKVDGNR